MKQSNWGYLPDYSSQNHTLKFSRQSRDRDSYHSVQDDEKIPASALLGGVLVVFSLGALMLLAHDVYL
jgi:hypothetical protein